MAVVGSIKELGKWNNCHKGNMKWSEGHVWVLEDLPIPKEKDYFMYKYVILNEHGRA